MNPVRNLTKEQITISSQNEESISNGVNLERGQSLIELLLAIAIFIIVVSTLAFFFLDSYVAGRLAQEMSIANGLAEEGLEAARSIRDNDWDKLSVGNHGLVVSSNNWIFQGATEDISDSLKAGERKISVEEIGSDIRKVTSEITWQFSPDRSQTVSMVTYLTNWAKSMSPYLAQLHYRWRDDNGGE